MIKNELIKRQTWKSRDQARLACWVRKVGSRGKAVFVEEPAESVTALDEVRRRVQHPQPQRCKIRRVEVDGAVRPVAVVVGQCPRSSARTRHDRR